MESVDKEQICLSLYGLKLNLVYRHFKPLWG